MVDRIRLENDSDESDEVLENKIYACIENLSNNFGIGHMAGLPDKTQIALVHIVYDIGIDEFSKMEKMWEYLDIWHDKGNEAAEELMKSPYALKFPERAKKNAELIREGGESDYHEENLF